MKKFVIGLQGISLVIFGLLTLFLIGGEPSNVSTEGIERYYAESAYWDGKILFAWVISLLVFAVLTAIRFIKKIEVE